MAREIPKADRRCGNCGWAEWRLTGNGNRRRNISGKCSYVVEQPKLPWTITASINFKKSYHRLGVWKDSGEGCPCWEPEEGS